MNRTLIAESFLTVLLLVCLIPSSSGEELWKLVGQSTYIVSGTFDAPANDLADAQRSGSHHYVSIPIKVSKCLKGQNCPTEMTVRYYSDPSPYSPSSEAINSASGMPTILFLVQVDDPYVHGFYFAGHSEYALQEYSKDIESQVAREIADQSNIGTAILHIYSPRRDPNYARVKKLLDLATSSATQTHAFEELESLGKSAVPAMIMLMDDRRPLAEPHISLTNRSPTAFEGIRHYGPKLVVDAADALLNQITGETFGNIANGGSERERTAAVRGWRIYLYHLLKDSGTTNGVLQR